ncbi:Rhamnolipids biosynthesis 3-oxoacyl-[acyl-carrier-protein] reductase [Fonsecaea pedrosoi]|nr:Rhamnolipids biosynthesis 3-oxoacyl-[acyl-carrier-protein] reductase [Fonsecaea pedrosoi]
MSSIPDFQNLFRLDGKVALVTGGSRGLGLHAATALLLAGARKVIVTARKSDGPHGLDQAVERLNKLPGTTGRAVAVAADISKADETQRLLDEVKATEPQLDILVANAGTAWGGPFDTTPDAGVAKVLDLNKAGTDIDPARVIIVSSTAGSHVPHIGEHGTIIYSASKAAADHLARNLAVELGPRNIVVNSVAPGFFPSKLASGLIQSLGGLEQLERENPRKRLGVPSDIAGITVFLSSPASSWM